MECLIDDIDRQILACLVEDARMSLKVLSGRIGLTSPSTAERLKRLEERGVIQGYGARVNLAALGYTLQALVRVRPLPGLLHRWISIFRRCRSVLRATKSPGRTASSSGWWCGQSNSLMRCWTAWRNMPSVIRRL